MVSIFYIFFANFKDFYFVLIELCSQGKKNLGNSKNNTSIFY